MKKQLFILSIAILIVMSGCAVIGMKKSQSLIGKWVGELPNGDEITMIFKDDITVEGSIKGSMDLEYIAKYSVDFSADPVTLDQYDFSEIGDIRYLAIIKFIDRNTFLICGNIDSQGDRPKNFDYDAFEMTRK